MTALIQIIIVGHSRGSLRDLWSIHGKNVCDTEQRTVSTGLSDSTIKIKIHYCVIALANSSPKALHLLRTSLSGRPIEPTGSPTNVPTRLKIRGITSFTLPPPPCE